MISILYGLNSQFEVSLQHETRVLTGYDLLKNRTSNSSFSLWICPLWSGSFVTNQSIDGAHLIQDCLQAFSSVESKVWNLKSD